MPRGPAGQCLCVSENECGVPVRIGPFMANPFLVVPTSPSCSCVRILFPTSLLGGSLGTSDVLLCFPMWTGPCRWPRHTQGCKVPSAGTLQDPENSSPQIS